MRRAVQEQQKLAPVPVEHAHAAELAKIRRFLDLRPENCGLVLGDRSVVRAEVRQQPHAMEYGRRCFVEVDVSSPIEAVEFVPLARELGDERSLNAPRDGQQSGLDLRPTRDARADDSYRDEVRGFELAGAHLLVHGHSVSVENVHQRQRSAWASFRHLEEPLDHQTILV